MNYRTVTSASLLLVVAAAIVVMIVRSTGVVENPGGAAGEHLAEPAPDRFEAVYFHGDRRCQTCETIETYAAEAVKLGFPEDIARGRLRFSTANYDQPANAHYLEDFGLSYQMVILIEYEDDTQKRWTALPRIWDLVQDKPAFLDYVRTEIAAFMRSN